MNHYIPFNKAVGPVCIHEGNEPLIDKKLGVDATSCRFDGSECEHASCPGAPEMFIKVEEDGLYYFGVEADDQGFIKIAGENVCVKDGIPPHGRLELETGSRNLKAGYYKVNLLCMNSSYKPVSGNAIAFNVTMDREPIKEGGYSGNSTMKRTFSASPKMKLWTIEKEAAITCEESREVEIGWDEKAPTISDEAGNGETSPTTPKIFVTACKDEVADVWRLRVAHVSCGTEVLIRTGGYRDALANPPTTEGEAVAAVECMNGEQARGGVLGWSTRETMIAHENHHRRQWKEAYRFYWKHLKIQEELEKENVSCKEYPDMDQALEAMKEPVKEWTKKFQNAVWTYVKKLPDDANSRPYCAGQKVLNEATEKIIALADAKGWSRVPRNVTVPGVTEPVCFLPPVNGEEN